MGSDDSTIVKIFLTVIILLGSGLTSIGTAGVSAAVGLAAIAAVWGFGGILDGK